MNSTTRLRRNLCGASTNVHMEMLEPRVLLSTTGADSIYVLSEPYLAVAGANIGDSGQAFVVEIIKSDGSVDISYNGKVSISVFAPYGTAISGILAVNAKNGIASFTDLSVSAPGTYTCEFSDTNGDAQINDAEISVFPAGTQPVNQPSQLRFIQQPTVAPDGTFSLTAAVEDALGNPVGNGSGIELRIFSGPADALLSSITGTNVVQNEPMAGPGTTVFAQVGANGIATFQGLGVNIAGSYTLEAITASPLSETLSDSFVASALPVVPPTIFPPPAPQPQPSTPPILLIPPHTYAAAPIPAIGSAPSNLIAPDTFTGTGSVMSRLSISNPGAASGILTILNISSSSPNNLLNNE